jgi:hypothetical protein
MNILISAVATLVQVEINEAAGNEDRKRELMGQWRELSDRTVNRRRLWRDCVCDTLSLKAVDDAATRLVDLRDNRSFVRSSSSFNEVASGRQLSERGVPGRRPGLGTEIFSPACRSDHASFD